jgi:hypothetical protein
LYCGAIDLGRLAVQRDLRDLHDLENPNIASSTTDRVMDSSPEGCKRFGLVVVMLERNGKRNEVLDA